MKFIAVTEPTQVGGTKPKIPASELRQDVVTGDWVVIATGRAKRPDDFKAVHRAEADQDVDQCPFENPEESGQEKDVLIYRDGSDEWTLRVFPNKYPAFSKGRLVKTIEEGPYFAMSGTGYHEVIVTRDHFRPLALMEPLQAAEVLDAYQERYLSLMKKPNVKFVQIFHNHGKEAGASIVHPHSQLMAIPVVSPYIQGQLDGAERYRRANKKNVFASIVEHERETGQRVVFENDRFVAFCPFASRVAFEIWVAPKKTSPYFERLSNEDKVAAGEALQRSLRALHDGLDDPAYNFYINTAPCDGRDYPQYGWHIEILPHTAVWAGFELSTGIEISTIQPEKAAEYLRGFVG